MAISSVLKGRRARFDSSWCTMLALTESTSGFKSSALRAIAAFQALASPGKIYRSRGESAPAQRIQSEEVAGEKSANSWIGSEEGERGKRASRCSSRTVVDRTSLSFFGPSGMNPVAERCIEHECEMVSRRELPKHPDLAPHKRDAPCGRAGASAERARRTGSLDAMHNAPCRPEEQVSEGRTRTSKLGGCPPHPSATTTMGVPRLSGSSAQR